MSLLSSPNKSTLVSALKDFAREFFSGTAAAVGFLLLCLLLASPHPFVILLALGIWILGWILRLSVLLWHEKHLPTPQDKPTMVPLHLRMKHEGPYGWLHAPEHTARFIISFSLLLATGSAFLIIIVGAVLALFHSRQFYKYHHPRLLIEDFTAFRKYQNQVPVFFPKKFPGFIKFLTGVPLATFLKVTQENFIAIALSFLIIVLISLC